MTAPTYDTTTGALLVGGAGLPAKGIGRSRQLQIAVIDLAVAVAAGFTSTHTVKLVTIPANTKLVIHAVQNLTTLVGTSYAVGDSTDEALFVAADSTTTTGHYATITSSGSEPGQVYAAANTLGVKLTAPTSGKIGIFYELIDLTQDALAVVP